MSTATTEKSMAGQSRSSFARIPAAFRLQFVVKTTFVTVPLIVFFGAWAVAIGIALWLHRLPAGPFTAEDPFHAGASQAALWCLVFMAAYAASHTFPFAMALSFSRRVYVIGAFLAFAAVSAVYGLAFALAALVERATDGYGIHAYTFDLPFLTDSAGIAGAGVLAAALCLLLMLFGFCVVILYRRLGLAGTWAVLLGVVVLLVVAAMLITTNEGWSQVWRWFGDQTTLTLSLWTLPAIGLLGAASYAMIRRAVPA